MSLTINFRKTAPKTIVTFCEKSTDRPELSHLERTAANLIRQSFLDKTFGGDKKESILFRQNPEGLNILVMGLGAAKDLTSEGLRALGAHTFQALKSSKLFENVLVDLEALSKIKDLRSGEMVQAFAEGIYLSDYNFDDYKSKKPKDTKTLSLFFNGPAEFEAQVKTAKILIESVHFARRLGDQPGNMMTPEILARETVNAAKGIQKLKVTVWDKARIKRERMGGLYSVALGSDKDPRFIIMEYRGGSQKQKPVCFVGKGLTFDCGGVSIKPSAQMEEMIYDMCGGANVIGALLAIAKLKLKVNVIGLIPSSENMVGPGANKPGDIVTARNGKTVEIFNTDAEGRLILMDALSYATELKPQAIFDAATLTGAMVVALSNIHTGVFTRDQNLMGEIQTAASHTGELVWPMPIHEQHLEDMKGNHADLCNISSGKGAGSSTAAAFLGEFVDPSIPWAHFDIAGTAWNTSNRLPYVPKKGATGVMIRTFVELARMLG